MIKENSKIEIYNLKGPQYMKLQKKFFSSSKCDSLSEDVISIQEELNKLKLKHEKVDTLIATLEIFDKIKQLSTENNVIQYIDREISRIYIDILETVKYK